MSQIIIFALQTSTSCGVWNLRIIAGDAKGRRLLSPQGRETRPTSDKVKESIFNILGDRVPDAEVLDLFAGTGNLGLEAISRGAKSSVFIDINRESIKIIHENIKLLKYEEYCEVYNNDSFSALNILGRRGIRFDIIFVDPPYHKDIVPRVLDKIIETSVLKEYGIIVAEHDSRDEVPDRASNLIRYKSSVYGDTTISFYKLLEE